MNSAIETIWAAHSPRLAEYICQKTNHEDHCHDLLQDVFLKIQKHADKVGKAQNVLPYILRMANNAVMDYYRTRPCRMITQLPPDDLVAAESEIDNPTSVLAHSWFIELIHALPPMYKQALIRTEIDGISQIQLAEELGISYSGAKSRVQRAKELLRRGVSNCCDYKFDRYGNVISCCGAAV